MVCRIDMDSGVCTAWPVLVNKVQQDITIRLKYKALEKVSEKLGRDIKVIGHEVLQRNVCETKENFKNEMFREKFRKDQLRREIRHNVERTLHSPNHVKSFDIGISNMETDLRIFGIDVCHSISFVKEYSYRNKNIECLDNFLGEEWDLFRGEISCRFVASFKVKMSKNLHLQLKVKTAEYPGILKDNNYRHVIHEHMLCVSK